MQGPHLDTFGIDTDNWGHKKTARRRLICIITFLLIKQLAQQVMQEYVKPDQDKFHQHP